MTTWGLGLPQTIGAEGPELLTRYAVRAEQLGFEGLWTIDNAPGGPTARFPVLDPLHALTYVASSTTTVRLGTAVIVMPRRHPVMLAKELATLDRLSGGRLTVGVGLGRDDETLGLLDLPVDRRVGRLIDGVAVMRSLWAHGVPDVDRATEFGRPLELDVVQRPGPPVWLGGAAEAALKRAARIGDGWIGAGASTLEQFAEQTSSLGDALTREGRDRASFAIAKRVYLGVERDRDVGLAHLAPALDDLYSTPGLAERVGVYGSVDECAAELRALVETGADTLVLTPTYDFSRQLEAFAEVVAAL